VAAEALRHPLAVAGRTFESFVRGIMRLVGRKVYFMAIHASGFNGITLVHGVAGARHQSGALVTTDAVHARRKMNIGWFSFYASTIRQSQYGLSPPSRCRIDFGQSRIA
jgi:hypothetical protein